MSFSRVWMLVKLFRSYTGDHLLYIAEPVIMVSTCKKTISNSIPERSGDTRTDS